MPPPFLVVRQFTFNHKVSCMENQDDASPDENGARTVPVANINVQVLSFDRRCFWVHLSEARESASAPPPLFGPCAVAFGGVSADVTSSILVDDAQLASHDEQGQSAVGAPNPQAVLAQSLSQRLARRLQKECAPSAVAVYVACGLTGEKIELLGTPAGSCSSVTVQFGAAVFRHTLDLIREEVLCTSKG